ncbi:tRNA (5-methylaminomethyl-2-thiouridine)(34)-methyltransferase MnmD [Rubellimicrobium aerolatum]|uniref:tRNA (5-methylaminomethyl-2-thiouridine)(34)-methyltransferase MnmD n=1 Tax=Rubellimicrobium aerolatum TaxID=490979 RepID=A0ABW0SGA1_9RHOB|nr:tRNA (5-methylaminomethyl-2-thiouridine)(34)-methyltransferase MnmD [Rubellimicrobium aerolatum]MBP1806635.1 tRNA U34 5-methylaminomethyl-2-thiouridine-forming methyltransferase MnmC [Rubellimicrobium aerolatum]
MPDQTAPLLWRDGIPVSSRFDDPYFSLQGGLAETRHVFLSGNDLPARFRPGFRILELGFGTGLNFLVTLRAHRDAGSPGPLLFTSLEAFPMAAADRARALAAFPEIADEAADLTQAMTAPGPWTFGPVTLRIIEGDARDTLPAWDGPADAAFLDGFAPARNPEMWEPGLLTAVAHRLAPGGTLATYSAAGHVRRALEAAGLTVERRPGFGTKRHMTRARRPA